ncbi:MAG: QueT transporter family protein [Lachnospiraceae bacterium]|nr:QueT transporter family protein [Lachnospiraceae bacterium]
MSDQTPKESTGSSSKGLHYIIYAGITAAIYVVLTVLIASFNLASGAIQVRISEALTILPCILPAAVPGVTIGCLLANIITGCALPDIIFGTLATFIGAVGTRALAKKFGCSTLKTRVLCSLPPVISNTIIVPLILTYAYHIPGGIPFFMLTVGAGELISCTVLGVLLLMLLWPVRGTLFGEAVD